MLVGCESTPTWVNDVRIQVDVSDTEMIVPRDTITVRVVATNASQRSHVRGQAGCHMFQVRDAAGRLLPPAPRACLYPWSIEYPAGERVEFVDRWYGGVGSESEPRTVVFAPPGEYRLEAILGDGLVSTPVTIRVRAAE